MTYTSESQRGCQHYQDFALRRGGRHSTAQIPHEIHSVRSRGMQVMTDVHAPDEFRAVTVRNLDAWYAAFEVQPGEKLYLAPGDRVRIW